MTDRSMNQRKIEESIRRKRFDHNVYTPEPLMRDVIDNIGINKQVKSILVLYNVEFVLILKEEYNVDLSKITLFANFDAIKIKICQKNGINFINTLEETDVKFDIVLGNPPYQGKRGLHQIFFNKAVDLLKDGGKLGYIQPASPYVNCKPVARKNAENDMLTNIKKYHVDVKFYTGEVFKAGIATHLARTVLTKINSPVEISRVEYADGKVYENVNLDDINPAGFAPEIAASLLAKFKTACNKYGNLHDKAKNVKENDLKLRINIIRANSDRLDFVTYLSADSKQWDSKKDFGWPLNTEEERLNAVSYLKTYIARTPLALLKIDSHMDSSTMAYTPFLPMDQKWDDEKLKELFEITDEEYDAILEKVPAYYETRGGL